MECMETIFIIDQDIGRMSHGALKEGTVPFGTALQDDLENLDKNYFTDEKSFLYPNQIMPYSQLLKLLKEINA